MRKEKGKLYLKGIILSILFGSLSLFNTESVFATPDPPPKPDRYTTITVEYITYEWWLMRWEDSELVCKIIIEHEDLPSLNEVYVDCGEDLYNAWIEQDACPFEIISQTPVNCPGYYLHFASSTPRERDLVLALPPPVVWINLKGCISEGGTNRCGLAPVLVLHGDEPLVEEELLRINGEL
ncbi:MAG: hypothetical protein HN741_11655, partial [Anaerolineae bacterium]|nr:hypothetical protein [Anaerolineae bacterium]